MAYTRYSIYAVVCKNTNVETHRTNTN